MRKITSFFMVLFLLLISIFLFSCSPESSKSVSLPSTEQTTANESIQKITLDEIKEKYSDSDVRIKNIQNIGKEWVLVQSQRETFADRFDIYNLETGDMDIIQEGFEFVTLEKVVNENYFVFLSSGKNSESIFSSFPYLINSVRIKNELNEADDFISFSQDKYFDLAYSVNSGSKEHDVLSDIIVTLDGFEVLFEPLKEKEVYFYADATDIPPTKTLFDKDKKQITFELTTNHIGGKLKNKQKINVEDNQFISSIEISLKDSKTYIVVGIKDATKEYMIKKNKLPNQFPYFSVSFREDQQ